MKVHIIYENYISKDGQGMSVGGIQTYLTHLISVIKSLGLEVSLYQTANYNFNIEKDGVDIHAFQFDYKKQKRKTLPKFLFQNSKNFISEDDIIIFGTDTLIVETGYKKTIGIQHGISWDRPKNKYGNSMILYFLYYCLKSVISWKRINNINKVNKLVCVDYNFVNWYRSLVAVPKISTQVIPNFADIPLKRKSVGNENEVKIIFARRFYSFRGTYIFAFAMEKILAKYPNVKVTFAGEGPDEMWLKDKFITEPRVSFLRYKSEDSLRIHHKHDIAVVPTIGSEGTSLSLLEAMAAECAVICSNVGGMTNIIIDEYNGLMFDPYEKDDLYNAIDKLIRNRNLRNFLSNNAYESVKHAFSLEQWNRKWEGVLLNMKNK